MWVNKTVAVFDCIGSLFPVLVSKSTCTLLPRSLTREAERQQTPFLAALILLNSLISPVSALLGLPHAPAEPQQPFWGGYAAACEPHHVPKGCKRRKDIPLPVLSSPLMMTAQPVRCSAH